MVAVVVHIVEVAAPPVEFAWVAAEVAVLVDDQEWKEFAGQAYQGV